MKDHLQKRKYFLLDANVVVAHYLPKASSKKAHQRIHRIVSAAGTDRKGGRAFVLFVPNFCVAEVFNTFRKHRYGAWNDKVKKSGGVIPKDEFDRVHRTFQRDIRKGRLFYHYELSRYHLLNTSLISPIDHHYAYQRRRGKKKRNLSPMKTFDLLIVAMGIELVRLHGRESVCILTDDLRMVNILGRAERIRETTVEKLDLNKAARLIGRSRFHPSLLPRAFSLLRGKEKDFQELLRIS